MLSLLTNSESVYHQVQSLYNWVRRSRGDSSSHCHWTWSSTLTFCTTEMDWGTHTEWPSGTVSCYKSCWDAMLLYCTPVHSEVSAIWENPNLFFVMLNIFVLVFSDFFINCQNSCIFDEKYVVLPISQYSSIQNWHMPGIRALELLLFHCCWGRLDFYINLQ